MIYLPACLLVRINARVIVSVLCVVVIGAQSFWVRNRRLVTDKALAVFTLVLGAGSALVSLLAVFLVHPAISSPSVVVHSPECPGHTPVLFW